ncbi:hypothetical protein PhCBS80983_g03324 [Powellomyces hirtus]|uniref:Uncharacterized protein n=1 Tax=Powellomyces hirtus TaxID=109895 RepID=A0A507E2W3_9FUNG|nr:hypothetical protein PhCBS80983_g03324 [Powellomyces hirtus]
MAKASSLLVGAAFGFVLEKTKVYVPSVIVDQMLFERFTMLKMFVTAAAGGMVVMSVLESFGLFRRAPKSPVYLGLGLLGGFGGNLVGGVLLGTGMSLSGSCPGTVLVQLGAGLRSAWTVMAGALAMSSSYGYLLRYVTAVIPTFGKKGEPLATVDQRYRIGYVPMALSVALVCGVGISILNTTHPWQSELPDMYKNATLTRLGTGYYAAVADPRSVAWSPVVGGLILAAVQGVSILSTGCTIGASSAFVELAAKAVTALDKNWRTHAPYYAAFRGSNSIFLAVGVVAGAATSAWLSGAASYAAAMPAAIPVGGVGRDFVGGALLLLGARIAGGCTSGHGISGIAQLGIPSLITVAAMFGGE